MASLQARLTLGTMALLTGGLLAGNVAAYVAVQAFLHDRVDRNLAVVADRTRESVARNASAPLTEDTVARLMPTDVYVAFYDFFGEEVFARDTVNGSGSRDELAAPVSNTPTTLGEDEDGGIRVVGITLPRGQPLLYRDGRSTYEVTRIVVGVSRADYVATLRRLVRVQAVSGTVILSLMLLASRLVLRSGLAPLRRVAETARQIGRGDLAQRLPVMDARTEIGAVSEALNSAFDQRENSDTRLRRFVADASHELRTPLSNIHGWADLYVTGGIDDWDGVDSAMSTIRAESQRMGDLVDQLLRLARLDAHEQLRLSAVDLTAVCAQAVADVEFTTHTHPLSIVASGSHWVRADEDALRRVVDNLLCNAVVHTSPGTAVELHLSPASLAGTELRVVDHGQGLTPEQESHAFDRFWRADSQRSAPGGTGLGLAIVRDIVTAHGGSIELSTTPGGGLTATVQLPEVTAETLRPFVPTA